MEQGSLGNAEKLYINIGFIFFFLYSASVICFVICLFFLLPLFVPVPLAFFFLVDGSDPLSPAAKTASG